MEISPKEKAKQLIEKTIEINGHSFFARELVITFIYEIVEAINWHHLQEPIEQWDYWNEVMTEVQNCEYGN